VLTSNGFGLGPEQVGWLQPVPASQRGDPAALRRRLQSDGYLYLQGVLDPEEVGAFRRFYFQKLARTGLLEAGVDPQLGIAATMGVDLEAVRKILFEEIVVSHQYEAFCTQPALVDFYRSLFGAEPFLHRRRLLRAVPPEEIRPGGATRAHYDLVYIREGSDQVLASWIPLGDCPVGDGGLVYLEGSHLKVQQHERAGLLRPKGYLGADLGRIADDFGGRWLRADYAAGDMVVHTAYLVHASLDNVGLARRIRLSTDIRFQSSREVVDWRWQQHWHDEDGL
jgi:Phytanoyl-CoA dioxygenase (PhyH)